MSKQIGSRGIWKYASFLPPVSASRRVTIGEGNTPLVRSRNIGPELGLNNLYFKLESSNPTGSYKDRIAAMGVSWALEHGKSGCVGTTSGNAGASVAAYSASAGLPYHLLVLEHIVEAKLMQVVVHGAKVMKVKGFGDSREIGDKVFDYIERQAERMNWEVLITAFKFNAIAMSGVKTISHEIYDDWGEAEALPDAVFVPVGGGGLFVGVSRGFHQVAERCGGGASAPKVVAVQSAGCSNIVDAWRQGRAEPTIADSTSQISGLQVPNAPDGKDVLQLLRQDGGWGESVPDESTWKWQEKLAEQEGILCEPAAAIALAGVEQSLRSGRIGPDSTVVCIVSGAGYKDNGRLQTMFRGKPEVPLCDIDELTAGDSRFGGAS